jgi:hypothetical protein
MAGSTARRSGRARRRAVAVLKKVIAKVDPATLVIDSRGKGGSLLPDIRAEGFDPQVLTSIERSHADEGLVRDIETDELRLPGVPMPDTGRGRGVGDVALLGRRPVLRPARGRWPHQPPGVAVAGPARAADGRRAAAEAEGRTAAGGDPREHAGRVAASST